MSRIIALCIEDCHPASEDRRFLRCCALTGLQPGLALSPEGVVDWQKDTAAAVRLVVSLDEKLVCYKEHGGAGAPPGEVGTSPSSGAPPLMQVHRGGRFVNVEEGKPIVLLDGDEITLGDRRLKLHVHGFVAAPHDPEFYVAPETSSHAGLARAAGVAGVALAGLMAVSGCDKAPPDKPIDSPPINVRDRPPVPAEPPMEPPPEPMVEPLPPMPPIDVRDHPPIAVPDMDLDGEPTQPMPPPPMEPEMKPEMKPVVQPIEIRTVPPVAPIPRRDDRPTVPPDEPKGPQGG